MSHSTHNRSFRRRVFPGNQLHWYWQPKTIKHNTIHTPETQKRNRKTALANKTIYTLIRYAFYFMLFYFYLRPPVRKQSGPYSYSPGAHTGLQTITITWTLSSRGEGDQYDEVLGKVCLWSPMKTEQIKKTMKQTSSALNCVFVSMIIHWQHHATKVYTSHVRSHHQYKLHLSITLLRWLSRQFSNKLQLEVFTSPVAWQRPLAVNCNANNVTLKYTKNCD